MSSQPFKEEPPPTYHMVKRTEVYDSIVRSVTYMKKMVIVINPIGQIAKKQLIEVEKEGQIYHMKLDVHTRSYTVDRFLHTLDVVFRDFVPTDVWVDGYYVYSSPVA